MPFSLNYSEICTYQLRTLTNITKVSILYSKLEEVEFLSLVIKSTLIQKLVKSEVF